MHFKVSTEDNLIQNVWNTLFQKHCKPVLYETTWLVVSSMWLQELLRGNLCTLLKETSKNS